MNKRGGRFEEFSDNMLSWLDVEKENRSTQICSVLYVQEIDWTTRRVEILRKKISEDKCLCFLLKDKEADEYMCGFGNNQDFGTLRIAPMYKLCYFKITEEFLKEDYKPIHSKCKRVLDYFVGEDFLAFNMLCMVLDKLEE